MVVRNFYVNARIDGWATPLTGGPQSKEGGLQLELTQRHKGAIIPVLKVWCHESGGTLLTEVEVYQPPSDNGDSVSNRQTVRTVR